MNQKGERLVDRVKAHPNELYDPSVKKAFLFGSHAPRETTRQFIIHVKGHRQEWIQREGQA